MRPAAVIAGCAMLLLAPVLFRFRAPLARWFIENRVEVIRRSRLQNSEYVQREIDSLKTPGSYQLSRLQVVIVAVFFAGAGVFAILKGLAVI